MACGRSSVASRGSPTPWRLSSGCCSATFFGPRGAAEKAVAGSSAPMRAISGFSSCAARSRIDDALAALLGASPGSWPPGSPNLSSRFSAAPLANVEVQIDRGRVVLLADDDKRGALCRADRHGRRVVEKVLVSTQPSVGVARKGRDSFALRAYHAGNRQVALRERDPNRDPYPDADVEQAQDDAHGEDEHEKSAATPTTAVPKAGANPSPPAGWMLRHRLQRTLSSHRR